MTPFPWADALRFLAVLVVIFVAVGPPYALLSWWLNTDIPAIFGAFLICILIGIEVVVGAWLTKNLAVYLHV